MADKIPQYRAVIDLTDYAVAGPDPFVQSPYAAFSTSDMWAGEPDISDQLAEALDIDMGSDARWLADPDDLVDLGGGEYVWKPAVSASGYGYGAGVYWHFNVGQEPIQNPTYAYKRHNKREVTKPAFIFDGGVWANLHGWPTDPAPEVTVLMVARLRRPYRAHRAGIIESRRTATDPEDSSDVYFRQRGHRLRTFVEGHHREHVITNTRRPHIVGMAHGEHLSKLVFVARDRHIKEFRHPAVTGYDMTWYLGRMGGTYDIDQTEIMDVLEINLWDSKLNARQLRRAVHRLNHIYGVTT